MIKGDQNIFWSYRSKFNLLQPRDTARKTGRVAGTKMGIDFGEYGSKVGKTNNGINPES